MPDITIRPAVPGDAFPLMHLYQLSAGDMGRDPLFLDYRKLKGAIESEGELWLVAAKGEEIFAVSSLLLDAEQRLCKIQRVYCAEEAGDRESLEKKLLQSIIGIAAGKADVIYSTSRCLTMAQMARAEEAGFKALGFFPIASADSEISGLVGYYYDGVLEEKRYAGFSLHPQVLPFYRILKKRLPIPEMEATECPVPGPPALEPLPELEMITASRFVARRFQRYRERKQLSNNFYPFQEPNTLICDADCRIEIFAGVYPDKRFATIIEERLEVPVHPSGLYTRVALMIRGEHISYVEVIIDAADCAAIDLMLQAGFLPCAYFPCLKKHGETRRDFVVLGRAFENLHVLAGSLTQSYTPFVREYVKLELTMMSSRIRIGESPGTDSHVNN